MIPLPLFGPSGPQPPGVVIARIAAATRSYVGSPSIARLPGGQYLASHDVFGPGCTNDTTHVYASADRGRTWVLRASVTGQWWSTLFVHRGALYLMGTSREYGHCVIRRSTDSGRTWTTPRDARTGLLLADGPYHCAPVPVLVHQRRVWRAMEDAQGPGGWGEHFRSFVMSAPVDANLLDAANWTCTNRIGRDPAWLDSTFGGWLEGNAVAGPDGAVVNVLRVDTPGFPERSAVVQVSADGTKAMFDPRTGFVDMPGGAKKFTIRFDRRSGLYWTIATAPAEAVPGRKPAATRNTLALSASRDLRHWEIRRTLYAHADPVHHGYQYVDWLFEGNDIIAVCRTAHDDEAGGAHNYHDANLLTFHRIRGFRQAREAP